MVNTFSIDDYHLLISVRCNGKVLNEKTHISTSKTT